jgi:hypothetical protein
MCELQYRLNHWRAITSTPNVNVYLKFEYDFTQREH